MAWCSVRA